MHKPLPPTHELCLQREGGKLFKKKLEKIKMYKIPVEKKLPKVSTTRGKNVTKAGRLGKC